MRLRFMLLLWATVAACGRPEGSEPPASQQAPEVPESEPRIRAVTSIIVGDTVVRFNGSRAYGWLKEVELVGELVAAPGDTFLVVAGSDCIDCDSGGIVLVRSLGAGPIDVGDMPHAFTLPGRVVSMDDSTEVVADTRLFWGTCLAPLGPGVLQLQYPVAAEMNDSITVIFASVSNGAVSLSKLRWHGDTSAARGRLPQAGCTEMPAVQRWADP